MVRSNFGPRIKILNNMAISKYLIEEREAKFFFFWRVANIYFDCDVHIRGEIDTVLSLHIIKWLIFFSKKIFNVTFILKKNLRVYLN